MSTRLAVVWVALALGAAPAGAASPAMKTGVRSAISATGTVPAPCDRAGVASFPTLAVDLADARRMTATWLTDGISGVARASSADGGRTWARGALAGGTSCTAGPAQREVSLNPRSAPGPGGRTWFGSTWAGPDGSRTAVHVADRDGVFDGGTDLDPAAVGQSVAIAPDPSDRNAAVALWARFTALGPVPARGEVVVQRTSDGGRTWTRPVVALASSGQVSTEAFAVRTPDGTLVAITSAVALGDVFASLVAPDRVPAAVLAARSTDGGRTWSGPRRIGTFDIATLADPEGREPEGADPSLGTAAIIKPDLAVGPDGTVVAVWAVLGDDGRGAVQAVRSTDAGRTWTAPEIVVRRPGPVFSPQVAIDGTGRVGAFFYDLSDDRPGDAPRTVVGRVVTDGRVVDLPSAFDLRRTYVAGLEYDGGQPLGVTQDLAGLPRGFAAAHTVGPPVSGPPTEVRLTTVVERRKGSRRTMGKPRRPRR